MCQCCIVVTLNRFTSERWCHEWWHIKTLNHTLICCLPSSLVVLTSGTRFKNNLHFVWLYSRRKWNDRLLQRSVRQVMLQYLETLDVLLNHRMHVNTRLQLRPEVRAACARALWNPFLSVCFCLLITWHHKPSKTERDSQRLVQIMLVRTQLQHS